MGEWVGENEMIVQTKVFPDGRNGMFCFFLISHCCGCSGSHLRICGEERERCGNNLCDIVSGRKKVIGHVRAECVHLKPNC